MDAFFGGDAVNWNAWQGAVCLLCSVSCANTGRNEVTLPLFLAGTDVSTPLMSVGDIPVRITRADLAFGPLYLCAGNTAGDLCDTARLEWLDTAVVDTTSVTPREVGLLMGVSGPVRSWMSDLGISSQLTRPEPYVLEAAQQLDGSSFVLEGSADVNGVNITFSANVPIQQNDETELGVPVIRQSSEPNFHELTGRESGLTLHFDPSAWVSRIDFRPYAQGCTSTNGCLEPLILTPDSEAYRSLTIALMTTGRPHFEWHDAD